MIENSSYQSIPVKLADILVSHDFDIEMLDSAGKPIVDPNKAEIFSFNYTIGPHDYGTVVTLITDSGLTIFYGDNVGRSMEAEDRESWYGFIEQLRYFAKRNLLTFDLKNMTKLKYAMQGIAAMNESFVAESYYGTKTISFRDLPGNTKLMIKHVKPLGKEDQRFRHVDSLYVENGDDERFKLPFKRLEGGRAMARHIANGGTPYDEFGQGICRLVDQINELGSMVRRGRRAIDEDDDEEVRADAQERYKHYRKILSKLCTARGYKAFQDHHNKDAETMKEYVEFDKWASVMESTWALPNTPEKRQRLIDALQEPVSVGVDALNAQEIFYDLIGDDTLYDELKSFARQQPDGDARIVVYDWLSNNPDSSIRSIRDQLPPLEGDSMADEEDEHDDKHDVEDAPKKKKKKTSDDADVPRPEKKRKKEKMTKEDIARKIASMKLTESRIRGLTAEENFDTVAVVRKSGPVKVVVEGRMYKCRAIPNPTDAKRFVAENADWAVLRQTPKTTYLARRNDTGVPVNEAEKKAAKPKADKGEPVEAYGVKGVKSTPWRKKFKNQAAYEKWIDENEGNIEVHGTRKADF